MHVLQRGSYILFLYKNITLTTIFQKPKYKLNHCNSKTRHVSSVPLQSLLLGCQQTRHASQEFPPLSALHPKKNMI